MEGFNYTAGMKAKTGPWTFDELNEWLHKPSSYVPGTRMTFAGITNDKDRANVIDYLRTLSPTPGAAASGAAAIRHRRRAPARPRRGAPAARGPDRRPGTGGRRLSAAAATPAAPPPRRRHRPAASRRPRRSDRRTPTR